MMNIIGVRTAIVAVAGGIAALLLYLLLTWIAISGMWRRTDGDLPDMNSWLEKVGWSTIMFPWGFIVRDIFIFPWLNGLTWAVLVFVGLATLLRRLGWT